MPYQERQTRIETNNHFIALNQIPARDYWLGSEYNSTYHDRLQINLSAIEAICRAANLPPLVIATEAWTPPRAHEPEIVGHNAGRALAGQKQALFRRQNEERPIKTSYVEMEPLPEHVDILLNDAPISIGWAVKINSRKIDYDFTQKHPNSNETTREHFFANQFDQLLRQSIMRVTFAETMVGRSTSKSLNYMQLLNQAISIYSTNPMKNIRNLLEYEAQLIFWQNLLSFGFGKIYRSIHSKEHRPWEDLRSILNVTMRASNLWREEKFPDRYQMEIQNSHYVRNRLLANFIPVGEVFHSLMAAAAIAYGPTAQSLVRLENKSDLHS